MNPARPDRSPPKDIPRIAWRLGVAAVLLVSGFAAGRYMVPSVPRVAGLSTPEMPRNVVTSAPKTDSPAPWVKEPSPEKKAGNEEQLKSAVYRIGNRPANGAAFEELLRSLRNWAALNPAAALAYARQNLTLQRQNEAMTQILGDWAEADAAAAWAWATANVPENGTQLDAVLSRLGQVDGATAWSYAAEFARSHPASAQSVYVSAMRGITHSGNFSQAIQLLSQTESLGAGVRDGLSTLVATEWGRYDPTKAVAWAAKLPEGSVGRERAIINVAQAWAEVSPAAAAQYAAQLPPGGARQQAVAQVFPNWVSNEPVAAAEWLYSQQPSRDLDQAFHSAATNSVVMEDFPSAVTLANAIYDPELRTQTLTRIVATLKQRDAAAAERFLQSSQDLPAEMRNAVRGRLAANDLYSSGK